MNTAQLKHLENDLWSISNNLRASSDLKSSKYAIPVLGLIFLKFAGNNYTRAEKLIEQKFKERAGTRLEQKKSEIAKEECGFYLPDHAHYSYLLNRPEQAKYGQRN